MASLDDSAPVEKERPWLAPVVFFVFVGVVVSAAYAVGGRYRSLHGADFFTGAHLDVRFRAGPALVGVAPEVHTVAWPLTHGSGSLRVRFETVRRGAVSAVTSVRVEPSGDLIDGAEARVRVTGYDAEVVGRDGVARPTGRAAIECVERLSDGEHTHTLELRGDGTSAFGGDDR